MTLKKNLRTDEINKKHEFNDAPVTTDLKKSITELRRIYSNFTDVEFAAWYNKRYNVPARAVLRFLASEMQGGGRDRHADSKQ